MIIMSCEILINGVAVNYVQTVDIQSSWEQLTDTARITTFNNFVTTNEGVTNKIKRGDEVEIRLGYNGQLNTRFKGYVKQITPDSPYSITCEDSMWLLKQKFIRNYSKQNLSLETFISNLLELGGVNLETRLSNITDIGTFRVDNVTIADALEALKSQYSIYSFFRDDILYVGTPYTLVEHISYNYDFDGSNNVVITDSLQYQEKETAGIVIQAISQDIVTNEKIIVYAYHDSTGNIEVSDTEIQGSLRTVTYTGKTKAELTEIAKRELESLSYTGYSGSFETFGHQNIKVGDICTIYSNKYKEKRGGFIVRAINDTFSKEGYRHNIYLDRRATI